MHSEADAGVTMDTSATLVPENEQVEYAELRDWHTLSLMSLWEVWDNDEDAVYDRL